MKYDVVIPALNEEKTIGEIVYRFKKNPRISDVHVMIDDATIDNTQFIAETAGATTWRLLGASGKGQLVQCGLVFVNTDYVILSDGDYTRIDDVDIFLAAPPTTAHSGMRIVVPKMPTRDEWSKHGPKTPFKVPYNTYAWAANSGFRSFPLAMINNEPDFHGYLLETQLNQIAKKKGYPITFLSSRTLVSPLRFTEERMRAMEADRRWGRAHGVFDV